MTEKQAPNPAEQEISEEEARAKLDEAVAFTGKQMTKTKKAFAYNIKLAQDRLQFAAKEQDGAREMRGKLEPHKADPEGALHYQNAELLFRIYGALKRMMEIEVNIHKHNLAVLEELEKQGEESPDSLSEEINFRYPEKDLDYLEARVFLDVHLATFHLIANIEGVDLLLRATSGQKAIDARSDEEEAERQAPADALKEAMKGDRDLAVGITQLGNDLQEALALLEWGRATLESVPQLPAPAKRSTLDDADWAKLNGKVVFLGELPAKARKFPQLAAHFPESTEVADLPYSLVNWSDSESTGRLKGTGPMTAGAGRAPGAGTGPIKRQ